MKRAWWIAIAVVIVANAVALFNVARNRSSAPDATVELSERELSLTDATEANSGMSLRLVYRTATAANGAAGRVVPRHVYGAFELAGGAWQNWTSSSQGIDTSASTRLFMVDIADSADELRARHPDRARVLILPCVALEAAVTEILGDPISVPQQFRETFLEALRRSRQPHYSVRIATGRNYAPYIVSVRALP